LAWSLAAASFVLSTLWIFSGESYRLDLLANLGAQLLLVLLLLAIVVAALRRRRAFAVALAACALQATPLFLHRAAFLPRPLGPPSDRPASSVRFLHYNDSCLSDKREISILMENSNADVLSILCPPVTMQSDVIYQKGLEDKYPGKLVRRWEPAPDQINTEISAGFVVSRWPITPHDCSFVGPMAGWFIVGVVERPAGRFALVAVHPRSPRSAQRWHEGNAVIGALVTLSRQLQSEGLPVVVLADLNATPTGWRSREACAEGGLRRAKPLFVAEGTYPDVVVLDIRSRRSTGLPGVWPASLAIDDALISPGIDVLGWEVRPRLRSEHRPVIVELGIPAAGASGPNPGGR
jgi:endonuclease/exonuclease/phosphatase family metal-dependent hydrolase